MFAQEREARICRLLERKSRLSFAELKETLGVSPATLRRDLARLEGARKLVRVHGGVLNPRRLRGEPSFTLKSREAVEAKRRIAARVAALIPEGATVLVDSGTTCLEAGRRLLERPGVRLVTNSVPLLFEAWQAGVSAIAVGGSLRTITGALTGAGAVKGFEMVHADWALVGASGLSAERGASTTEMTEAASKQAMLRAARRRVLLADGRKWESPSRVVFAGWDDFHYWVTSAGVPKAALRGLSRHKMEIFVA